MKVIFGGWGDDLTTSYVPALNTWMHICGTYDGTIATIFVNGTNLSSAMKTWDTTLIGAGGIYIGQGDTSLSPFTGKVDEVRIYNRVLAPNEILALSSQLGVGLARQYSFNGGSLSDDNGGPSLAPVASPTTTPGFDAAANGAYSLNGVSQYFTVADTSLPMGNSPRTLCAWVNLANNTVTGIPISYGQVATGQNSLLASIAAVGVSFGSYGNVLSPSYQLQPNSWSHFCGVLDAGGNAAIYINGQIPASGSGPVTFSTVSGGALVIGARSDLTFPWSGSLDSVRIYNRALSGAEIQELQNY